MIKGYMRNTSLEKDEITFHNIEKNYWNYYLELENDMLNIRKYVDFSNSNNNTYSLEFLKLILSVCSEIDVFGKVLASLLEPSIDFYNHGSIKKWWYTVQNWYENAEIKEAVLLNSQKFEPWNNYFYDINQNGNYELRSGSSSRTWWNDYNSVKHERSKFINNSPVNFTKANLKNVGNAFAALYILEKNCLLQLGTEQNIAFLDWSKLFERKQIQPFMADKTLVLPSVKGNILD